MPDPAGGARRGERELDERGPDVGGVAGGHREVGVARPAGGPALRGLAEDAGGEERLDARPPQLRRAPDHGLDLAAGVRGQHHLGQPGPQHALDDTGATGVSSRIGASTRPYIQVSSANTSRAPAAPAAASSARVAAGNAARQGVKGGFTQW